MLTYRVGRLKLQGITGLLVGSWDLVTIYNWDYKTITLVIIGVTPLRPFRGFISRVISPVISSYYFP